MIVYYLNGERWNGSGKEYDSKNNLIFVGEYVNGKKKGKYKEYDYNELIFEGECLYDFKIKGKEYDKSKLVYEGDYLYNQKFNGKFKKYNNNVLRIEGEYLNGKINGKYKEYNDYGTLIFEGEYLNNINN